MYKILLRSALILLLFLQMAAAQGLVENLGPNRGFGDPLMRYDFNKTNGLFYVGSSGNGHLNEYNPATGQMNYILPDGHTRPSWDLNENYGWTVCVDDSGIVYGGSCQGTPLYAYAFYPGADTFHYVLLNGIDDTFIWSSAAPSDSFVYFGTDSGTRAKLIRYNKYTYEWYDVFDSLYRAGKFSNPPFSKEFVGQYSPTYYSFLRSLTPNYPGELKLRSLCAGPDGLIYGGTESGFVFAYNPATDDFDFINVNEAADPDHSGPWYRGGVGYLEADTGMVFASVYGSDSIGTIEVDLFANPPHIHKIPWWEYPEQVVVHGGDMEIIGDTLFVDAGDGDGPGLLKYNLEAGSSTWMRTIAPLTKKYTVNGSTYLG